MIWWVGSFSFPRMDAVWLNSCESGVNNNIGARGGPCRGGFAVSARRRIRAFLPPGFKGFAYKLRSYSRDPVRVLTKPVLNLYFHSCFCITDLLAL